MSLYNNVSDSISGGGGLFGAIRAGINSALGSAAGTAAQAMGGGKVAQAVTKMGQSAAVNAAMNAINKHVPLQTQRYLNVGAGVASDLIRGDWDSAGMRVLQSGVLNKFLSGFYRNIASQAAYWGSESPLWGGITPAEAKRICEEIFSSELAKKNLWLLEVTSRLSGGGRNMPDRFNLFATEVEYAPFIIEGDKNKVGGSVIDMVQGGSPVELRLTTLDDKEGSLKRWFADHTAAVAARDGTIGKPNDYAVTIKMVHAFITQESNRGGYEDIGMFRPVNLDINLSRREDGLEELAMTFLQLDTFMRV
ncbi:MAG: hypothetical protein NC211_03530 [Alistipes senegalensis]|nr:hypothetical protein [Oxalobacter formigenes]MCM1280889.1 hypothetical protein [Alistipes senegalensis]